MSLSPERSVSTTKEVPNDANNAFGSLVLAADNAMHGEGLNVKDRWFMQTEKAVGDGLLAAGAVRNGKVEFGSFGPAARQAADAKLHV